LRQWRCDSGICRYGGPDFQGPRARLVKTLDRHAELGALTSVVVAPEVDEELEGKALRYAFGSPTERVDRVIGIEDALRVVIN
jgi:hypothetical protein